MRATDFLAEYDYDRHYKIVNQAMAKAGYRKKGQGGDAVVYSKDAGTVIKIIMPMNGDYSSADNAFLAWYKFCQQHAGNPHLPQFQEIQGQHHSQFEIDGEKFRQIAMEKLKPMPEGSKLENAIHSIITTCEENKTLKDTEMAKLKYTWQDTPIPPHVLKWKNQEIKATEKIIEQYPLLYKTLKSIIQVAARGGFRQDLSSTGNIMLRTDGTPVITDPWA